MPTPMVSATRKQPPPPAALVEMTLDLETARELTEVVGRATATPPMYKLYRDLLAATAR